MGDIAAVEARIWSILEPYRAELVDSSRPVSAILLVLAVAAIMLAVLPAIRRRREVVFAEDAAEV